MLGRLHQTKVLPSVSCVQLVSTQLPEVLPVRNVVTPTSVPLDQQSASRVPPDKSSPPAGPVTTPITTQQVPACGDKVQAKSHSCITISVCSAAPRKKISRVGSRLHRNHQDSRLDSLQHNRAVNLPHARQDSQVVSLVDNLQVNRVAGLVGNLQVNRAADLVDDPPEDQQDSLLENHLDSPLQDQQLCLDHLGNLVGNLPDSLL